jgi:hypothetical protein
MIGYSASACLEAVRAVEEAWKKEEKAKKIPSCK